MTIWEEKEIIVKNTKVRAAIKCDICGKIIADRTHGSDMYFQVHMSHEDWGNDSVDSVEYFDVCSQGCLRPLIEKYLDYSIDSNTYHLEVQQDYCRKMRDDE